MHRYKIYDIENFKLLKPKQTFVNYFKMCDFLNTPKLVGNSKKAQFNEWRRFIKFKVRENKSIIILEIYSNPLPVIDGRSLGNNRKYENSIITKI